MRWGWFKKGKFRLGQTRVRLLQILKTHPNRVLADLLGFLILTGARKSEAANARWEGINLDTGMWIVPMSKSGKPRFILLSRAAVQLLEKKYQPQRIYSAQLQDSTVRNLLARSTEGQG